MYCRLPLFASAVVCLVSISSVSASAREDGIYARDAFPAYYDNELDLEGRDAEPDFDDEEFFHFERRSPTLSEIVAAEIALARREAGLPPTIYNRKVGFNMFLKIFLSKV